VFAVVETIESALTCRSRRTRDNTCT